ncbi:AMP-binding protein [Streptomyces rimosus]|uniref:AMP-binding protein n=1 Tax=Streptomyces rimosus TaxID=1927 RepID=UPI00131B9B92|nr:AMP-binding protein [Streptomyces rimosus]
MLQAIRIYLRIQQGAVIKAAPEALVNSENLGISADAVTALLEGRYVGLAAAAYIWAAILWECGGRPGDLVPVLLSKSAWLVALLLGVVRRDAAYTTVDSHWPQASIREPMEACGPSLRGEASGVRPDGTGRRASPCKPPPGARGQLLANCVPRSEWRRLGVRVLHLGHVGCAKAVVSLCRVIIRLFTGPHTTRRPP